MRHPKLQLGSGLGFGSECGTLSCISFGQVKDFTQHITKGCPQGPRKCGKCKVWAFLQDVPKPELADGGDKAHPAASRQPHPLA